MSQLLETVGPRAGAAPLTYELAELGTVDVQSVFASFNGAAASGDWRPALTIRSQNGTILSRTFPDDTLTTGDTADVTYAPFLGRGAAAAGGGIQFDTDPQEGGSLVATTTVGGITLTAAQFFLLSSIGASIIMEALDTDGDISLEAGSDITLRADDGRIDLDAFGSAAGIELDSRGSAGISFRIRSTGQLFVKDAGGNVVLRIDQDGTFNVFDDTGQPTFRADADGDLHGKTGKALTFDL